SCDNGSADSENIADEANEQKFDAAMEEDAEFVVEAADGGMMEVKLGELAQSKAVAQETKDFAAMMITEHSKANEELSDLAMQKNITLPSSLSNDKQEKYEELTQKNGMDFDKAYIAYMVKDHKEDVDLFKKEAEKGNDPELKNWAAEKVPILEHHLHMAKQADSILSKQ